MMLGEKQLAAYQEELARLAARPMRAEEERALWLCYRDYAPDRILGRELCRRYTTEALIQILRGYAGQLGRAPAQAEVFFLYRTYIKHRFGTWPAALRAAGLSRGRREEVRVREDWAGLWEREGAVRRDLIALSERRESLGYPPNQREAKEVAPGLRARFGDWAAVLAASEALDRWLEERGEVPVTLGGEEGEELRALARRLGRPPLKAELPEETRCALRVQCGSWDSVLLAAGLTPFTPEMRARAEADLQCRRAAGSGALERIPDLSPRDLALLAELRTLCRRLGRAPRKEETPAELRGALIHRCGSWRNALYQIGVQALSRQEESRIKQREREDARRKKRRGY